MKKRLLIPPIAMPILFFGGVIATGALLLHWEQALNRQPITWTDAFFTATSATCVTGLSVFDTAGTFSLFGQSVLLVLMQIGGLGIMTFTGLFFFLWRHQVSLTDRIAVGEGLLHDPTFHLGRFFKTIVAWTLLIELCGAFVLFLLSPQGFSPFSALFHAVSAFCNAGFSINSNSLESWRGNLAVNLVFMILIILGGLGFSVLAELQAFFSAKLGKKTPAFPAKLSGYARLVIRTSFFLILAGAAVIFCAEFVGYHRNLPLHEALLSSVFQSVTCRTAGFNTLPIGELTNVSLLFMILLMFIGGAPGSCAGGIKVTTFRVLTSFLKSQIKGRQQAVLGKFAADPDSLNKALVIFVFAGAIIIIASMGLNITEGGDAAHPSVRGLGLEIFFETVSAFGTVGLSTGLTAKLSMAGKWIITLLMFIGRLGPMVFLAAIQSFQKKEEYLWPEENILIG